MDIIAILAFYRNTIAAAELNAERATRAALRLCDKWAAAAGARGDDYRPEVVAALAREADKAEHFAAMSKQSLDRAERAMAEWAYGLPWGAHCHGRVFVQRWRTPSGDETTQINVDGIAVYNNREGFISLEEGLRRKAAAKAANKAAQAAYDAAMASAVRAVDAGIPLAYSWGQQGGTFEVPAHRRVSASGLCRVSGKTIQEIEEGEPRVRFPASRKARNDWRSQECPIEYV